MIFIDCLGVAAAVAAIGYVRVALFSDWGTEREQMPLLLIAFILALGFIGLLLK